MGIPIHRVKYDRNPVRWFFRAHRFFRSRAEIAIVHAHGATHFIPVTLLAAKSAGIPVRIAHSHAAKFRRSDQQTRSRRTLRALAVIAIRMIATRLIGISNAALEEIAGPNWRGQGRAEVLLYGFDYTRNDRAGERAAKLRTALGISEGATVIGHVGRFDPVKNHELLVRSFAEFVTVRPHSALVMVGVGPTLETIVRLCETLGIADRVYFPGTTDDVPAYMAMFDLFVLPSLSEGLGIVCLEAQAAGTRSLVSTGVPTEVCVIPDAVFALSLDSGPKEWANEMCRLVQLSQPQQATWRAEVENSSFGIKRCVSDLNRVYESELKRLS
jgi:glycosyltransferase involved in cell wall biosynthesis